MTPETFFKKFALFADAPDAVARMRELVIHLAVQGRLVPQNSADEAARVLAATIANDRAKLVADRSLSSQSNFDEVPSEECPFVLPAGWLWTRLGNLCRVQAGFAFHSAGFIHGSSGVPIIRIRDIKSDRTQVNYIGEYREEFLVDFGDYLVGMDGNFTVAKWRGPRALLNQRVSRLQWYSKQLEPVFFAIAAQQRLSELQGKKAYTTVDHLSSKQIEDAIVPFPPLAEQKRIVAKVDELMALCDRLEAQQKERETRHAALARASLARFSGAPTIANLNLLFHKTYDIAPADLRKTILTLAVQGKLVPQNSNEEPVDVTFEGLESHNKESNLGLTLPNGWEFHTYSSLTSLVTSGSRGWKQYYSSSGAIFIRTQNIKTDNLVLHDVAHVDLPKSAEGMRTRVLKDDILITITGANVTKAARITEQIPEAYVSQHIALTRPRWSAISPWLHLCFISHGSARGTLEQLAYGDKPGLNLDNIRELVLPIPPLTEQRRIVAKVDELTALVGSLEMQIAGARTTASNLLEAVVADLAGIERKSKALLDTTSMKMNAVRAWKPRALVEPLKLSTRSFVLRRFKMESPYRSLGAFDCNYHLEKAGPNEASPICLVGLNGSGKSNLIEAIAEVFCFLELINLPWKKVESASSRYRENRHRFELEYTIHDAKGERLIRVRKLKKSGAEFFIVKSDGAEDPVAPGRDQLLLLPRRIVGYSSGLNETVSHPFLRTKTIYSEEVRDAAPPEGVASSEDDKVFDTRTLYMDYESNAAILICNFVFRKQSELAIIDEFTRVRGVSSFGLHFNRKRAGKSGIHRTVRLTGELHSYLKKFAYCAGAAYDETQESYDFSFKLTHEVKKRLRQEFKTAENLFMAMHKWSLLNALVLSDEQRKVYLRSDITKGALERPPSVPPSDRVFDIVDLKLNLSVPPIEIDYSGLSDGEHQFIQVFGTAMLFSAPGTLFLLDEPESHFNPGWRTKFNLILKALPNATRQEYVISTHSPFIVSGSRKSNVYKFERNDAKITFAPVDFETYGASFDVLLKKLFSIDSLIDQSAKEELQEIIKRGKVQEMKTAVGEFAESKEKRKLYEAIITEEDKK
jgi:type I restriction enzyme S subunit